MVLAKPCASDSLKETRDKDSSLAADLKTMVLAKPAASDSLKEAALNGGFGKADPFRVSQRDPR